jgi:dihydrofolate reductase
MINIIVALDKNRTLGKNNDLVWKGVPGDMKRFKEITTNHPIIMGRKTFESIGGKALPNRTNIVITRNPSLCAPDCIVVSSLDGAIKTAKEKDTEIFVIGGGEIYSQAIKLADRLYVTLIDANADGDVFFPDYGEFTKIISSEEMPATEKFPYTYKFLTLEK